MFEKGIKYLKQIKYLKTENIKIDGKDRKV